MESKSRENETKIKSRVLLSRGSSILDQVYCTQTTKEYSMNYLIDLEDDYFAVHEDFEIWEDDTSPADSLTRIGGGSNYYLYSKHDLAQIEESKSLNFKHKGLLDLLKEKGLAGSSTSIADYIMKKESVKSIQLPEGRVFVSEGNLMYEPVLPSEEIRE